MVRFRERPQEIPLQFAQKNSASLCVDINATGLKPGLLLVFRKKSFQLEVVSFVLVLHKLAAQGAVHGDGPGINIPSFCHLRNFICQLEVSKN